MIPTMKKKGPNENDIEDGQSRLEKTLIQWTDFSKMDLRKKHDHECKHTFDEIPDEIRNEFTVPHDVKFFELDFNHIKK